MLAVLKRLKRAVETTIEAVCDSMYLISISRQNYD